MSPLAPGAPLPDVEVVDATGRRVSVRALVDGRPLVLFFYPKDDSPGCTREACSFRDRHADFLAVGAVVAGVSADDAASHARFAARHGLPYPLYSDPDGRARAAFGIGKTFGLFDGRVTFVSGADGVVRHTFSSQLKFLQHVDEALRALGGS